MSNPVVRALKWAAGEVWEKINLPAVWRELRELGRKHGRRFFVAAVIWEIIEDGVFPLASWLLGVPELIPLFLIFHFEPIAYPAIFWLFRQWDRKNGLVPEHPERGAHSASWRSWVKALNFNIAATGFLGYSLVLTTDYASNGMVLTYVGMMTLFSYVHERIWHDSNYGILDNDDVEPKRNIAKTATYRIVALMVMYPLMKVFMGGADWTFMLCWHVGAALAYFGLETVWSKSQWGLSVTDGEQPPAWVKDDK